MVILIMIYTTGSFILNTQNLYFIKLLNILTTFFTSKFSSVLTTSVHFKIEKNITLINTDVDTIEFILKIYKVGFWNPIILLCLVVQDFFSLFALVDWICSKQKTKHTHIFHKSPENCPISQILPLSFSIFIPIN